ncbi:unnamed protein product, partial [marine sediment metagenome]
KASYANMCLKEIQYDLLEKWYRKPNVSTIDKLCVLSPKGDDDIVFQMCKDLIMETLTDNHIENDKKLLGDIISGRCCGFKHRLRSFIKEVEIAKIYLKNFDYYSKNPAWYVKEYFFNIFIEHKGLLLKGKYLELFDKQQLRLVRNSIFAHYGRPFRDKKLRKFFNKYSWYKVNEKYSDNMLTERDRKNIQLIITQEKKLDGR